MPKENGFLFVTFKVTCDGERGHPMEHTLVRVEITDEGSLSDASLDKLTVLLRREVRQHAIGRPCPPDPDRRSHA